MNHITNVHHDQTIDDENQAPPPVTVQDEIIPHSLKPIFRRVMSTPKSPLFLVHEKVWNIFQSFPMEEQLRQVRVYLMHAKIPRAIMLSICQLKQYKINCRDFREFLDGKRRLEKRLETKVFTAYINMKYDPKVIVAYLKKNKHMAGYFLYFEDGVAPHGKCPSETVLGAECRCHF